MRTLLALVLLFFSTSILAQGRWVPTVSSKNSTATALSGSTTWTGEWELCFGYPTISVAVATDQNGTMTMQFSNDKTNIDSSINFDYTAGSVEPPHRLEIFRQWCRVKFENTSASDQTYLRLQTIFKQNGTPSAPLNVSIGQDHDAILARVFPADLDIAFGRYNGVSVTSKFGKNTDIDTANGEPVCDFGGATYTGFPSGSAEAIEVFSDNAADTSAGTGARTVRVVGLDANFEVQAETVTLNGTTPVDTANTYLRAHTARVVTAGSGGTNAGNITFRHTTTTANQFLYMLAGRAQTNCACYTVPAGKTGIIKRVHASVRRATSAAIDAALYVRNENEVFRYRRPFTASQTSPWVDNIYSGVSLSEKTDLCLQVSSTSANNTEVTGGFDIIIVDNP